MNRRRHIDRKPSRWQFLLAGLGLRPLCLCHYSRATIERISDRSVQVQWELLGEPTNTIVVNEGDVLITSVRVP